MRSRLVLCHTITVSELYEEIIYLKCVCSKITDSGELWTHSQLMFFYSGRISLSTIEASCHTKAKILKFSVRNIFFDPTSIQANKQFFVARFFFTRKRTNYYSLITTTSETKANGFRYTRPSDYHYSKEFSLRFLQFKRRKFFARSLHKIFDSENPKNLDQHLLLGEYLRFTRKCKDYLWNLAILEGQLKEIWLSYRKKLTARSALFT